MRGPAAAGADTFVLETAGEQCTAPCPAAASSVSHGGVGVPIRGRAWRDGTGAVHAMFCTPPLVLFVFVFCVFDARIDGRWCDSLLVEQHLVCNCWSEQAGTTTVVARSCCCTPCFEKRSEYNRWDINQPGKYLGSHTIFTDWVVSHKGEHRAINTINTGGAS